MELDELRTRLMGVTALGAEYCVTVENAREMGKRDFVVEILRLLPRIYIEFSATELETGSADEYYSTYVDEDYYESVRRNMETLLGSDDIFLETFEEDMKYSDTPVAASISESLADIFQVLYNFISIVKESEGESVAGAYAECRENFDSYWSQTLCNVMRALNNLRYNGDLDAD